MTFATLAPLRDMNTRSSCALRATVRLRGTEYSPAPIPPQTATLPRLSLGLSMIQPLRGCRRMHAFFGMGSLLVVGRGGVEGGLGCALRASRVFEALSPTHRHVHTPGCATLAWG